MQVKVKLQNKLKNQDFEIIFNRIKKETDLKNLSDLARIIGITPQNASARKNKNIFPADWAFIIAQKYNLLTEWIMTGQGPKRINDKIEENYFHELVKWAQETGKSENIDWVKNQIDELFPMFIKWRKRKDETEREDSKVPASKIA